MSYILAIDQSTAGTKAVLFNKYGAVISRSDLPHRQIVDERGWVEHDPVEIITNVNTAAKQVVEQADILPEEIKAIGLSNQRETVVCWDRETSRFIMQLSGNAAVPHLLRTHLRRMPG